MLPNAADLLRQLAIVDVVMGARFAVASVSARAAIDFVVAGATIDSVVAAISVYDVVPV
jgi:hypothetical protein